MQKPLIKAEKATDGPTDRQSGALASQYRSRNLSLKLFLHTIWLKRDHRAYEWLFFSIEMSFAVVLHTLRHFLWNRCLNCVVLLSIDEIANGTEMNNQR